MSLKSMSKRVKPMSRGGIIAMACCETRIIAEVAHAILCNTPLDLVKYERYKERLNAISDEADSNDPKVDQALLLIQSFTPAQLQAFKKLRGE